jgi:hypothetical protein
MEESADQLTAQDVVEVTHPTGTDVEPAKSSSQLRTARMQVSHTCIHRHTHTHTHEHTRTYTQAHLLQGKGDNLPQESTMAVEKQDKEVNQGNKGGDDEDEDVGATGEKGGPGQLRGKRQTRKRKGLDGENPEVADEEVTPTLSFPYVTLVEYNQ